MDDLGDVEGLPAVELFDLAAAREPVGAVLGLVALLALFAGSIFVLGKLVGALGRVRPVEPRPRRIQRARTSQPVAAAAGPHGRANERPCPVPPPTAPADELAELATWRYRQLLALDVEPLTAVGAALAGTDVSLVRALIEHGCPPELALSIVW